MIRFLHQSLALSLTNLRSVHRRAWISLSMVCSVALVVVVLLGFLSMANGFRQTLDATGADDVGMVVSRAAIGEAMSSLSTRQTHLIEEAPGIERTESGQPIMSAELLVPVDAVSVDDGQAATLSLRGVGPQGLALRANVDIASGRMFEPGAAEIIVGQRLAGRYQDMDVGDTISFGRSEWTVVGHFTAGGSVFESEMMTDRGMVQTLFDRQNVVQSVRVKLTGPERFEEFRAYVEDELDMGLTAHTEKAFFAAQASDVSRIILFLGWPLAIVMAIGAAAGAMTTMYSSVSDRRVEIATVRAIGYSRGAAFMGTLVEAVALTVLGCAVGVAIAWLGLDGWSASTRGGANTQLAFELALSWPIVVNASIMALCVGFLGGGLPAFRATRVPLRSAMTGRS
ncbi:FtsX-like permease family protein [Thalassococcus sp. S3]|uniref:ABC transporter permease n=1 Tax=Thalassococcus sp. S3 TaxID=2017482 RepID=UPI0010244A36|nr:FtsX-like permease family protein [Thalassococcus sp. S3]QBF29676.1 ABC transporter permease [Thalassococcus sp. S3]